MKIIIQLFWFLSIPLYAQEFNFKLYLEDATGARDTLTFGFDATATDSIDSSYGEVNILTQPISSTFEARISDLKWGNLTAQEYENEQINFQVKKQIEKKKCADEFPLSFVSGISLYNVTYPLKLKWNKMLFQDSCVSNTFITDWHPSFWFDISIGNEQGPFLLKNVDSVELNYTTHHFISNQDTSDLLFFKLASKQQGFSDISNFEEVNLNIYPSPTHSFFNFEIEEVESYKGLKILLVDYLGKTALSQPILQQKSQVFVETLSQGIYHIFLVKNNTVISRSKLVKL